MTAKALVGRPWFLILLGWLVFIVAHACVITVRAMSKRSVQNSQPFDASGYSETPFLIGDGLAILVSACLVAFGTAMAIRRRLGYPLRILMTLIAFAVQLTIGVYLFLWICIQFHLWAGGPL